ncbi:MAG: VOC family protein [Xanthomonadales bacterium]|nr:VOC family protein [Xanthomonadales bacterium]
MKVIASAPHFFVSDIHTSVRFYVDVLGFDEPDLWGDPPAFAMPRKDGFVVMLNQADTMPPSPNGPRNCWDAYFWVDRELDGFSRRLLEAGADIAYGPEVQPAYGMKELAVRDPDGYMLVFAEDIDPQS